MSTVIVSQISTNKILQVQANLSEISDPFLFGESLAPMLGVELNDINCKYIQEDIGLFRFNEIYYLIDGIPSARIVMPCLVDKTDILADGIDYCTISNVPLNAELFINDLFQSLTDGTDIEIKFDLANTYDIKLVLSPYLDWEEEINAS